MEGTKAPTRDYPALSSAPWNLWEVLYARRSHRKYLPPDPGRDLSESLQETARLALAARGAAADNLLVVTDPGTVERIKKRLHKGMQGKINLWLNRSPVQGFLVLAVPKVDARADRPRELPLAAVAAEDIVLWLTEAGMGTCWLGGLSQKEMREILGLGKETFVAAAVPFGKPKPRVKAMDMDHMMYLQISRKRKPLPDIACRESMQHPYELPDLGAGSFAAASIQDITGLLGQIRERRESATDVPLELAVDACLEAARIAPSAGNVQNWHFVAVSGDAALRDLAAACGADVTWRAAVVGVGDPDMSRLYEKMEKPFWMIDVPIALSQMSLMASSMGLALDLCLSDIDEKAVNATAGLEPPHRAVGVLGIR